MPQDTFPAHAPLAPPARTVWLSRLLDAAGPLAPRELDAERIADRVRRRTGQDVEVPAGMRVLLEDAVEQDLTPLGQAILSSTVARTLRRLVHIRQDSAALPRLSAQGPRAPIIITGLHRTGTTTLQRLLALDPRARSLPFWLTMDTGRVLPVGTWPLRATGKRLQGRLESWAWNQLCPNMRAVHRIPPDAPEEELVLLQTTFQSPALWYRTPLHGYLDWVLSQDMTPAYQLLRARLAHLAQVLPGEHMVLKCPTHLLAMDALLTTFPDARVVVTHRDPAQAIPSFIGLVEVLHEPSSLQPRNRQTITNAVRLCVASIDRMLEARSRAGAVDHIADVDFRDLVAEPVRTVHALYERFGIEVDADHDRAMAAWLARRAARSGRRRTHDPDRYGLTAAGLRGALADYVDRFGLDRPRPTSEARPAGPPRRAPPQTAAVQGGP